MSAAALLAELADAGIELVPEGEHLRVRGKPAALAPFRERIAANKPALLEALADRAPVTHPSVTLLATQEATALGLPTTLAWVRVPRGEVEASTPPAGWDGSLPDGCRWPQLCQTLGPCPFQRTCGMNRPSATENAE